MTPYDPKPTYKIVQNDPPPAGFIRLPWYARAVLWIERTLARLGVGKYEALSVEWRHCSTCPHPQHCAEGDGCMRPTDPLAEQRRLAQLFIDVPTAAWLDPNLYGDDPNWRARLFPPKPEPVKRSKKTATAIRGHCERCGGELIYKRGIGATRYTTLCKGCGDYRDEEDDPFDHFNEPLYQVQIAPPKPKLSTLPCGCSGEVTTRSYPSGGWDMGRYAVCETCGGCWDYAAKMDDQGNPRKMHPRSGPVGWPNGDKRFAGLPPLPCGCRGEIRQGRTPYYGYPFCLCSTCGAQWEPPSNDPSGRRLAQGESVCYPKK